MGCINDHSQLTLESLGNHEEDPTPEPVLSKPWDLLTVKELLDDF